MGGVITQQVLSSYSERIASATLLFTLPSFAGEWMAGEDSRESGGRDGLDFQPTREAAIEESVKRAMVCMAGSTYPTPNVDVLREAAAVNYDRSYRPDGWRRQWHATNTFVSDEKKLASLGDLPAAVIHGTKDPFFSTRAAIHLHGLLENSELHIFPGMAHEIPQPLSEPIAQIMARTVRRGINFTSM